jgi:hypothetical protein
VKDHKPRTDLPKDIEEALAGLFMQFRAPAVILRLKNGILTPKESRLVGKAGITKPAPPEEWVSGKQIIEVVARQRQLTLERALLDLARSLDMVGAGKYEQLRKAIGEPVHPDSTDKPKWDKNTNQLWYKGQLVRDLSPRAIKARMIFAAFEEGGWPPQIDNPLPGGKNSSKLRDAVRTMNEGLRAIKFFCDGKAEGVTWQEL